MADAHRLVNIIVTEHGVGGVCSCGKWGSAQRSKRALKTEHAKHKLSAGK